MVSGERSRQGGRTAESRQTAHCWSAPTRPTSSCTPGDGHAAAGACGRLERLQCLGAKAHVVRPSVAAHLKQQTGIEAQLNTRGMRLQCERSQKVAALCAITAANAIIRDIRLRAPSLEDVFFGLSE